MKALRRSEGGTPPERVEFTTTHWSVVAMARDLESPHASAAVEALCCAYWYPLYAYVRRQGHPPTDAQDLTQAFFAHLLSKDFLREIAPAKGRFRSFLLTCLKRFLADHWRKEHTAKRGGGQAVLSLDEQNGEARYLREPSDPDDPETLFERRWAILLLDRVLDRVEVEFANAGKKELFARLLPFLLGEKGGPTYAELATALGLTEGAIKMAVLRLRERYRALFRAEIAATVAEPAEIEDEIRHVMAVLGASRGGMAP